MSRLRVGLLVGADGPRAWHEQVITNLANHDAIELIGIYAAIDPKSQAGALWRWIDRVETTLAHKLFRTKRADVALATSALDGVPASGTIAEFEGELDLLIRLDGLEGDLGLPSVPKHGVWHLTFDGADQPPDRIGLLSWHQGRHVVDATLWRTDAGSPEATPIERAYFSVYKPSWSVNRSRLLWRAALLVADNVIRLAASGTALLDHIASTQATVEEPVTSRRSPPHPLLLGLRFVHRVAGHIWRKLFDVEQWQVLVTRSTDDMLNPSAYARLKPPPDRFWADPFAVHRKGKDYIFVEELRYKSNRGEIAVLEHQDGELLSAKTIIAEPYHMSYPYIVEHQGDLYMVPETREKRSIDIWKNTSFPDKWAPVGALMENVSAVDTTLFRHDGRWWMFTNLSRTKHLRSVDELHAFYTDDASPVTKAWKPHRLNPLIRDTRFARQGGRVFVDEEGRLIRSAQDTAVRYGYAVLLFHVEELTPTGFAETLLHKVEPDWHDDVVGMHTFERSGDLCVFDACFVRGRLRQPL